MIRKSLLRALALAAVFLATPAAAAGKTERIDALMKEAAAAGQFSGAALVVQAGSPIYRKSFGHANREWAVPNTVDTKFRVGSVTKSFTAILVLQQVERGKLALDTPIAAYLPDFPARIAGRVTLRHLLTHTSGLPDFNNVPDFFRQVQGGLLSREQIVARIGEYELLFEPGSSFSYSNDGYELLGAVLERVTGKPYRTLLRENILNPLGMRDTGYSSRSEVLSKRASGYRRTLAGYENVAYFVESPASGMYSTVDDLLRWEEALYGERLLSAEHKALMWGVSPNGNAYGWLVSESPADGPPPRRRIVSEGAVPGFFAWTARYADDHNLIVLLTNERGSTNHLPALGKAITNILYGRPYEPPPRSIAETLLPIVQRQGAAAAIAEYRRLKRTAPDRYSFALNELNGLGYHLLNTGQTAAAVAVLELNVEAYPQSYNAHDSLGEAYMRQGDKARAIASYERSVALNPLNRNGVEMLKRLRAQ